MPTSIDMDYKPAYPKQEPYPNQEPYPVKNY